jgi:uncharacterized protein YdiU (UPF0061 family)
MSKMDMDFTNTFWHLSVEANSKNQLNSDSDFMQWKKKWYNCINSTSSLNEAKNLMRKNNPVVIPRNNLVDDAIKKAVNGNTAPFNRLLKILSTPYQYQEGLDEFMKPPEKKFEECFQTYCGT